MNDTDTAVKFTPIANRVLLDMEAESDKTAGGILYRPDSAKERPMIGRVVAIGEGKYLADGGHRPCNVREGDRVYVGFYTGQDITIDSKKYRILFDEDILGVFHASDR